MFDVKAIYEAHNIEEVIHLLDQYENSEIISGGTDVLIKAREGKLADKTLISIHNIKELKEIKFLENGDIFIGAGASFYHITNHPIITQHLPMLGEAVDTVGGPQIRNTGTIGGNICNGATSADSAASMQVLDAIVVLHGRKGKRLVPISEFYTGPGRTVRMSNEVCEGFIIPKSSYENCFGYYYKYGKRYAMEIATLGCAAMVKLSDDKTIIEEAKLGYAVAGPTPLRCRNAEDFIKGHSIDDVDAILAFGKKALEDVNPRSSWRASKEFRLQLIEELAKRCLKEAIKRAGGKINA